MTRYEAPRDSQLYTSKFIRVGQALYVTNPGDLTTPHDALAEDHGILSAIDEGCMAEPDSVDAGFINVCTKSGRRRISLGGQSTRLHLPITVTARHISITVFEEQSPDFTVKEG